MAESITAKPRALQGARPGYADALAAAVLFLSTTGTYRLLAPLTEVDLATVSAALLILSVIYFGLTARDSLHLLSNPLIRLWGISLVLLPLVLVALQGRLLPQWSELVRQVGLRTYLFALVLMAAVLTVRRGWAFIHRLALLAVAVVALGFLLNWALPSLFFEAAEASGKRVWEVPVRGFSFYLQPNLAALSINALFIVIYARRKPPTWLSVLSVSAIHFLFVIVTGSRSGIFFALLLASHSVFHFARKRAGGASKGWIRALAVPAAVALVLVILLSWTLSTSKSLQESRLGRRLEFFIELKSPDEYLSAMGRRVRAQFQYLTLIEDRPLIGHGPTTSRDFIWKGRIVDGAQMRNSSHNLYLEKSFQFGIPYTLFLLLAWALSVLHPARLKAEHLLRSPILLQVLLLGLGMGFFTSTLLETRAFLLVLGAAIGFSEVAAFSPKVSIERPAQAP